MTAHPHPAQRADSVGSTRRARRTGPAHGVTHNDNVATLGVARGNEHSCDQGAKKKGKSCCACALGSINTIFLGPYLDLRLSSITPTDGQTVEQCVRLRAPAGTWGSNPALRPQSPQRQARPPWEAATITTTCAVLLGSLAQ